MKSISLDSLIENFKEAAGAFPDIRRGRNLSYSMADTALGAFSVFFTQSPSFLAHQQLMQNAKKRNNARSLFGITSIPSDNQIRNLLDSVPPQKVFPVFDYCFNILRENGYIDSMRVKNGDLLIALDGTWYFSSDTISCKKCLTKEDKKGAVNYYHSMVTPVVVSPGNPHVIVLSPEYIIPQDGKDKQDCENQAAKRWITGRGKTYSLLNVTITGDDLYSRQSICKELISAGFNFILVCKEESHQTLYDWFKLLEEGVDRLKKTDRRWNGKYHEITAYSFANNIPLRDSDDAIKVAFCEVTVIREEDGRQLYHNGFISSRPITKDNVEDVVISGRTRWKVENESNNTLKTKGYHLDHNYGHGKKYLASLLTAFTLIAFLFHTMLDILHETYKHLRSMLPSRESFFNDIRALTSYCYFESWDSLFVFMVDGLTNGPG